MSGSVNKVILIGNLGKDPQERRRQDGKPVVTLSIATSETWRDKTTGERMEKTEWHSVVIFHEGFCETATKYLKKGAKIFVEGQLQTREYEKDGIKRYRTDVVLNAFNSRLTMLSSSGAGTPREDSYGAKPADDMDDDIPF